MIKTKITNERICAALLAFPNVEEAAAFLKVSVSTIYKRIRTPEFDNLYQNQNYNLLKTATEALRATLLSSIQIAREIAEDEDVAPQIRLNACDLLIRHATKLSSIDFADEKYRRLMTERQNKAAEAVYQAAFYENKL